jgi:hypothetical protein
MGLFLVSVFIAFAVALDPTDFETHAPLWLITYKTWEKNYAAPIRYLMWCGDGTDDCNVPKHWKYDINMFTTRKAAIEWINGEFATSPERVVSLRKCSVTKNFAKHTTNHTEVKVITSSRTQWSE